MLKRIIIWGIGLLLCASISSNGYAAEVTLAWDASSGEVSGYRIYYGEAEGSYPQSLDAGLVNQYTVTGLQEGTTYFFVARAYNDSGESADSNMVSWDSGTASTGSAKVSWIPNSESDLDGYRVYYGTSSRVYGNPIPVGNVTSHTISQLQGGMTYYFAVTAVDTSGNESGYSSEVHKTMPDTQTDPPADTTSPSVLIESPTKESSYETNSASIDLSGSALDNVGVVAVNWSNSRGGSGAASGTGPWSVSGVALAEGENVITITAVDAAGNEGSASLRVTYSSPDTILPTVAITSPTSEGSYTTSSGSIDLSGSASDNVGVVAVNWSNSRGGSGAASGTDAWSVSGIALAEGENVITITAVDAAGNEGSASLRVIYASTSADTTVPTVVITPSIDLSGSASDNVGVVAVNWSNSRGGSGVATGTDPWSVSGIALAEGENVITITAVDAAGNQAVTSFAVTYGNPAGPSAGALNLETGEVSLDHNWRRVTFGKSFADPVVVAKPLSLNGSQPAVVRIRNVDATGFELRIQEWEYLDGTHVSETVSYLVMERGSHTLPDGTRMEAGTLNTDKTDAFGPVTFNQPFQSEPVVLAAVTTVNEADAVTCRMKNITTEGFELRMQEQEKNAQSHAAETVSYIAWEPSSGTVGDVTFEVGRTEKAVTHAFYGVSFSQAFEKAPAFLADMQTTDGDNTANVRWRNRTSTGIEVQIDEEQSKDSETTHVEETIGYLIFSR